MAYKNAADMIGPELRSGAPRTDVTLFTEGYSQGDFLSYADGTNTVSYLEGGLATEFGIADIRVVSGNATTTQASLSTALQTPSKTISAYESLNLAGRTRMLNTASVNTTAAFGAFASLAPSAVAGTIGVPLNAVAFINIPGSSVWKMCITDSYAGASGDLFVQDTTLNVGDLHELEIRIDRNNYVEFIADGTMLLRTRQKMPTGSVRVGAGVFAHTGLAGGTTPINIDWMRLRYKVNRTP
jgi:hypothetical protein